MAQSRPSHCPPDPTANRNTASSAQLWKSAAAKAGVDPAVGLHFHDLRHTGNQLTKGAHLKT
jgi:integrase